jgi:hypothetical protein
VTWGDTEAGTALAGPGRRTPLPGNRARCQADLMREVPEPEREEWVARLRERARQDAEELLPSPPFRVYGLLRPDLGQRIMAEFGRVNGVWTKIALAYGNWAAPAGPWVRVTTATTERDAPGSGPESGLLDALDQERNRIASHAGVDEEEPAEPPAFSETEMIVDGRAAAAMLCRHGTLWAARLLADGAAVTVVGRGPGPGSVRLAPVDDLAPYLQGYNDMLAQLAERHRRRPPPVLPPAEGLAVYWTLIEETLASQARLLAALKVGRTPRHRADEGAVRNAMWQRAVREQARLSGSGRREAEELVTLVVNHMGHLAEEADWFSADPVRRETAIDETLRYSVLGEDVPSRDAQQAWARYWHGHLLLAGAEGEPPRQSLRELHADLEPGWLGAWRAWTQGR